MKKSNMLSTKDKIYYQDISFLAFQPIVDLSKTSFANLSSAAVTHWLSLQEKPSQWGAFMYFYEPTRALLRDRGVDIETTCFRSVKTSNPKWKRLVDKYACHEMLDHEIIYFIRLLYYLGFYSDGMQMCKNISCEKSNVENIGWKIYLKELGKSLTCTTSWKPTDLITYSKVERPEISSFLRFHIFLLLSKYYIRFSKNPESGKFWNEKCSSLIENSFQVNSETDFYLSKIRYLKYSSEHSILIEDLKSAEIKLLNGISLSQVALKKYQNDPEYTYLINETQRRVFDSLVFLYANQKKYKEAKHFAKEALKIDPYCGYANFLCGKISLKDKDIDTAIECFRKAVSLGIIERYEAEKLLSEIRSSSLLQKRSMDLPNSSLSNNNEIEEKKIFTSLLTRTYQSASNDLVKSCQFSEFKTSINYKRFVSFWELNQPKIPSPILCQIPLFALKKLKDKPTPWFSTLYLQRAMPANFREDLFFAASPSTLFTQINCGLAGDLNFLRNRSESINFLFSNLDKLKSSDQLSRIYLCRLLGSLGYYNEAIKYLPRQGINTKWSLEDEYAFCTDLFLKHIYLSGKGNFPVEKLLFGYQKLSVRPESYRMRLTLAMLGIVINGKKQNVPEVMKWRVRGFRELFRLQDCELFSDFEKQLLTSRYYRACSYYPFLINDKILLKKEADICESTARLLTSNSDDEDQNLLQKENLFLMIESISRIYMFLDDSDRALKLMEELVNEVDPYDAKAWIQVGDLREKNNGLLKGSFRSILFGREFGRPDGRNCLVSGR